MNLSEYQKQAATTAVKLPDSISSIQYSKLGLIGEAGEVAEKIKKLYRDNDVAITPEFKESLVLELGDVCWYVANLATNAEINLSDIYQENLSSNSSIKEFPIELMAAILNLIENYTLENSYNRVFVIIACFLETMNLSLEYTLDKNIEKLMSRKQRNVIHGNGDVR